MKTTKILIADDHSLVRYGLSSLLGFHKDLVVVGEAKNGAEAVELSRKHTPDVVIMDLMMPIMNGVEATRRIKAEHPETNILILTTFGTAADVARAIEAGAIGALMKDSSDDFLITAIHAVAKGKKVFSPDIENGILSEPPTSELTSHQGDLLESVTRGLSNRDVAEQFGISQDAVKQQMNVICSKLGAANRVEAVSIALRKHLLKMETPTAS